jgi:protoporphyrinogen oxidase
MKTPLRRIEVRVLPQGHPDYRLITQEIWRKIQEVHPALAEVGKFIDWNLNGHFKTGH